MKKDSITLHPVSGLVIVIQCLYLFFIAIDILGLYYIITDEDILLPGKIVVSIFIGLIGIFLLFIWIRTFFVKVKLTENEMVVSSDYLIFKFFKIQYGFTLNYSLIEDIRLKTSRKNSKGGTIPFFVNSRGPALNYIEFDVKGERNKKRINVTYFSKKQIIKMLSYIIEKIKLTNENFNKDVKDLVKIKEK